MFVIRAIQWLAMTVLCSTVLPLNSQTIAEKKAGITGGGTEFDKDTMGVLKSVNSDLVGKEKELNHLYQQVQVLYANGAPPADFKALLDQINATRAEIGDIADRWRNTIDKSQHGEGYALWNQPQTTLGQLVIDFGSQEYVYVIPPEIGAAKIGIASTIPVPRALWGEMLEMILAQNGIGIRQLNPYVRLLYALEKNQSGLALITNKREDLEYMPSNARVGYLVSPDPSEVRRVGFFLERFMNPKTTSLQMVGRDMLIVSTVSEVKELLKLYDFVSATRGQTEYKLVPLLKVDTDEMAKVLQAMFEQFTQEEQVFATDAKGTKAPPPPAKNEGHGLKVIALKDVARAVFLVGTREEIERAETIIREVESAVGSARDKVVYTYKIKHSDPEAIGKLINQIYGLLVSEGIGNQVPIALNQEPGNVNQQNQQLKTSSTDIQTASPVINLVQPTMQRPGMYHAAFPTVVDDTPGFFQNGQVSINPTPIAYQPTKPEEINKGRDNFLVDPRTAILVMVVDPVLLPRLKALLKRIDVPKKQVQLDVMLLEYTNNHTVNYGMNLLSIGGCATNSRHTCLRFDDLGQLFAGVVNPARVPNLAMGALEFLITRPKSGSAPAFDLSYRWLMTQSDATITSNPSVMTENEEKASIQIKTETSISTGIVEVVGTNQNVGPKDAFTRAQYGTQIDVTPTIHTRGDDPEDFWDAGPDYVTLENYILFDDVVPGTDQKSRPDVLRRQVKNKVSIADGQTVIIGGLRRKSMNDSWQGIPFIGELPGIGKLFSNTALGDNSQETFIFITPTIIYDHCESMEKVRRYQLSHRPGDIPDFMAALDDARRWEKEALLYLSMEMLFGRERTRTVPFGDDSCRRMHSGFPMDNSNSWFIESDCGGMPGCFDRGGSFWNQCR